MTIANTTLIIKKSGVSGNVPSTLNYGELGLNYFDGKLFYKNASGQIVAFTSGSSNVKSFATINSNSSLILASSNNDTLSIVPGNNITISTNTSSKTITISANSNGSSSPSNELVNGTYTATLDNGGNLIVPGTVFANGLETYGQLLMPSNGVGTGIVTTNGLGNIYFNTDNSLNFIINNTYQHVFNPDGTIIFGGGYIFPNTKGNTNQVLVFDGGQNLYWQDQTDTWARNQVNLAYTEANSATDLAQHAYNKANLSASGNPFDQALNTTDNVTFNELTVTANAAIANLYITGGGISANDVFINGNILNGNTTITQVPASQFELYGMPFGANGVYGYGTSMFDGGLVFAGYYNHVNNTGGNGYNADVAVVSDLGNMTLASNTSNVYIISNLSGQTTGQNVSWNFATDGSLTLPPGAPINFDSYSSIQAGMGFHINSQEPISIQTANTADANNIQYYGWSYNLDGSLGLPQGGLVTEGTSPAGLGKTITLIPGGGNDANQKLLIYPTVAEGNHLHLTSGDLSSTSLFLGNDSQYVRTKTDGSITIGTNDTLPDVIGGSANRWTFTKDGTLKLSDVGNIAVTDSTFGSLGPYTIQDGNSYTDHKELYVLVSDNPNLGTLFTTGDLIGDGTNPPTPIISPLTSDGTYWTIKFSPNAPNYTPSLYFTGNKIWNFSSNGVLTLPSTNYNSNTSNTKYAEVFSNNPITIYSNNTEANITLRVKGNTDSSFVFDGDGILHLPENGDIVYANGNSALGGGSGTALTVSEVNANGSTSNVVSSVNTIEFDTDSGFDVRNLGGGVVKVGMNSTFKYWEVDGVQALTANGIDTVNFIGANGISISASNTTTPQSITFDASPIITKIDKIEANTSGIYTSNTITDTTSILLLDSFPISQYRTGKYLVQASNETDVQSLEVMVNHNDVNAFTNITDNFYTSIDNQPIITITSKIDSANGMLNVYVVPYGLLLNPPGPNGDLGDESGLEDLMSESTSSYDLETDVPEFLVQFNNTKEYVNAQYNYQNVIEDLLAEDGHDDLLVDLGIEDFTTELSIKLIGQLTNVDFTRMALVARPLSSGVSGDLNLQSGLFDVNAGTGVIDENA